MDLLPGLRNTEGDSPLAVCVGASSSSRERLLGAALATASRLAGIRTVAVHATPSMATLEAVTGALLAGTLVVPLAADVGVSERDHILRDSCAEVALGPWPWDDTGLEVVPLPTNDTGRFGRAPAVSSIPYDDLPPQSAALVMYTSGTTGPPKGALLSRRALAADLDALYDAWEWTAEDHLVHGLPLSHVHGLVLGVLGALRIGCRLTHTERPTPEAYAAARGTLYFGVPTVWSRIAGAPGLARELSGARLLVSGSASLSVDTFTRLEELTGKKPVERYGMTETLITLSTRADGERRPGWVGWPLSGVTTRIAAELGALEPGRKGDDEVGELQVRGPTMFDGYIGRAESTEAGLTDDGWWRTGDAASVDAEGCHRIMGRMSTDLIKSGGHRVGSGEVEDALLAHPDVTEAAVVGAVDADLGQRIVAYVVAERVSSQDLITWVAERLSAHKRPREVRMVDALPRNSLGKVQKTKLLDDT